MHESHGTKTLVLFGPPGVGKSTLINLALTQGIDACDFELMGNNYEERLHAMKTEFSTTASIKQLYGAADLKLSDIPTNIITVLLLPPKEVYVDRLQTRDDSFPKKRGQNGQHVYDVFQQIREDFDIVLSAIESPEETLNCIKDFIFLNPV